MTTRGGAALDHPLQGAGPWLWRGTSGRLEVRFLGFAPESREEALRSLGTAPSGGLSWLRQVHSAVVRRASPGETGEGDALWTADAELGVSVVTADCVPILLGGGGAVAAIHAGWRGIAAGIIGAARRALPVPETALEAWIGPAIGPCCYEVGDEVAERVIAASSPAIAERGPSGRLHLDLQAAATLQLAASGVVAVRTIAHCTRCNGRDLASYRRDGRAAGRNLAVIWQAADAPPASGVHGERERRPATGRTPR